jgi:hypothetical protein
MLLDFLRYRKKAFRMKKKIPNDILHLNDMWLKKQWKKAEKMITASVFFFCFCFSHVNDLFHLRFYLWRIMKSKNKARNLRHCVENKSTLMDVRRGGKKAFCCLEIYCERLVNQMGICGLICTTLCWNFWRKCSLTAFLIPLRHSV